MMGDLGERKTVHVFVRDELLKLLRTHPEERGELPYGMKCLLEYEEVLEHARQSREELGTAEWFPPLIWIIEKLGFKWIQKPNSESATDGKVLLLERWPETPEGGLFCVHELGHACLKRLGIKHEEGDAFLFGIALVFPPKFWNSHYLGIMVKVCNCLPVDVLIAWGQRWNYDILPKLFPDHDVTHPEAARRARAARREKEQKALKAAYVARIEAKHVAFAGAAVRVKSKRRK